MRRGHDGQRDLRRYEVRVVAVAWYTPETWRQLCAVSDDVAPSHDEFVLKAERQIRQLEAQGYRVEKVTIDINAMVAWCRKKGLRPDAKERAAYGAMLLMVRDDPGASMDAPLEDGGQLGRRMS